MNVSVDANSAHVPTALTAVNAPTPITPMLGAKQRARGQDLG